MRASSASQIEPVIVALVSRCPLLNERAWSSKPCGSAGNRRADGQRALTASAMPPGSPPPGAPTNTKHGARPPAPRGSTDSAPGGGVPRDEGGIVMGGPQHGAAPRRDVARDRLGVFALGVVEDALGTERGGALAFGPGGVARHDDHRRHVEELRGGRHTLRVV